MKRLLAVSFVLFLIDRYLKGIIWFSSLSGETFFKPTINENIAFSLHGPSGIMVFLQPVIVIILLGLANYIIILFSNNDRNFIWWSLIFIGALSNLMDRIQLGGVMDYIDIGWWPVFNLSDVFITVGVFTLLYKEIKLRKIKNISHKGSISTI